jgi:phage tail-like protein
LGPLGTLGGKLPPSHIALTPDGTVYLLDRDGRRVRWFDCCTCSFIELPCLGKSLGDARNIETPVAIAAARQTIVVAGRHGGVGKAVLLDRARLSIITVISGDFIPGAVTLNGNMIAISDAATGNLLVYDFDGRLRHKVTGVGPAQTLTPTREGLMAVTTSSIVLVDSQFKTIAKGLSLPEAETFAGGLPFGIDALGRFVPGRFCTPPAIQSLVFTPSGTIAKDAPVPHAAKTFVERGRYVSAALDSRINACQWHRVVVTGKIPAGCRISLRTRTEQMDFPPEVAADEAAQGWSATQVFNTGAKESIECLIASEPGRWLWLEATLEGSGSDTPEITRFDIEFPRIALNRYLPAGLTPDPVSFEFTGRFLANFDTGFRTIESKVDRAHQLYDPGSTPPPFLDWLAGWVGLFLPRGIPTLDKRRLIRALPRLYAKRGTLAGLEATLAALLGIVPTASDSSTASCAPRCLPPSPVTVMPRFVLEHWRLRRWLHVGRGRLGATARLWGESILRRTRVGGGNPLGTSRLATERDPLRDPFHAHAHRFSVFLPAAMAKSAVARAQIESFIRRESPAHTEATIHWVEANMRLGLQSTLGFDTVIGAKSTVPFGTGKLGHASVLAAGKPTPLGFATGKASSLGRTTDFALGGRS